MQDVLRPPRRTDDQICIPPLSTAGSLLHHCRCAGISPTDPTQNRDSWMIVPPAVITLNGDTDCDLIGTSFGAFRDQAVSPGC